MTFARTDQYTMIQLQSSGTADESLIGGRDRPIRRLSCDMQAASVENRGTERMSIDTKGELSIEQLIECHFEIFSTLLDQVHNQHCQNQSESRLFHRDSSHLTERNYFDRSDSMVVDEISEVIEVDDSIDARNCDASDSSSVGEESGAPLEAKRQLRLFLAQVASLYHENPFHNFRHASHVTFSAYQLLRRIVSRDLPENPAGNDTADPWRQLPEVNGESCALASDALAQFAVLFSALIHDVDHSGVPNATLVKEGSSISKKYMEKSVAEQNSVDMAWAILENENCLALRSCIFPTRRDYERFRSMVVNVVMATDIADASLRSFQELKWGKSFGAESSPTTSASSVTEMRNRKVTVVMDLVMMASDISHTMQSFDVFCRWNRRLFHEMHKTFRQGRSAKDPSEFWYKGEFFFFDKHIIPLAERLQESGVFGKAADSLLENARNNRAQWETHGAALLERLQEEVLELEKESTSSQHVINVQPRTSMISRLASVCCRGSKPMYLQAKKDEDEDDATADESESFSDVDDDDYRYIFGVSCFRSRIKKQ